MTAEVFERVLLRFATLMERHCRTGMHMSSLQYARIAITVYAKAPANLLIFRCAHDSLLWANLNGEGNTLFIEDDPKWSAQARDTGLDLIDVLYGSRLGHLMSPICWPAGFDIALTGIDWQVILVDGPPGVGD